MTSLFGAQSIPATGRKLLDPTKRAGAAEDFFQQLQRRVIGQLEAVTAFTDIYQMFLSNLCSAGRPLANFLFLGPTGTGKTRIVEAAAGILLGSESALVKIDCAEFQHSHEIAKLIGSPPGYLGHRETHPLLSQEVLNQFHTDKCKITFVLFDEIEKASDSLWNLLLGILDKAKLTLGDNRKVDFSRAIVVMTSNLGSGQMSNARRLGFHVPILSADEKHKQNASIGTNAARGRFTTEFYNRLDKVVTFQPLSEESIRQILDLELMSVQSTINVSTGTPFTFACSKTAKAFVTQAGFDERYGARHLKRALHRLLVGPISNLIGSGQITTGDRLTIDSDGSQLLFFKE